MFTLLLARCLLSFLMSLKGILVYSVRWILICYLDLWGSFLFITYRKTNAYFSCSKADAYLLWFARWILISCAPPRQILTCYVVRTRIILHEADTYPSLYKSSRAFHSLEEVDQYPFTYTYRLLGIDRHSFKLQLTLEGADSFPRGTYPMRRTLKIYFYS